MKAPGEEVSTCRSKGPDGELIVGKYDHVVASQSLQVMIKKMNVVDDFDSRRHFGWRWMKRFKICEN